MRSMTIPRAGPAVVERVAGLLAGLDALRGRFKEAAARVVAGAAAAWVADLVRRATGAPLAREDDPDDPEDGLGDEYGFAPGWGVPHDMHEQATAPSPAWPWLLALALVLAVPALRLAGPASLAAALAP